MRNANKKPKKKKKNNVLIRKTRPRTETDDRQGDVIETGERRAWGGGGGGQTERDSQRQRETEPQTEKRHTQREIKCREEEAG